MIGILTLNGGGLITLKRLFTSIDRYVKDIDFVHIVLVQGDYECQDYIKKLDRPDSYFIFSPTNLPLAIGYNHLIEFALRCISDLTHVMILDDDFELKANAPKLLKDFMDSSRYNIVAMQHSWYGKKLDSPVVQECGGGTLLIPKWVLHRIGYIDENLYSEWDADITRRMTLCHNCSLAIAPDSKHWARHYHQTGQRKHGMKRFRKLQRHSLNYIRQKWGVSGIAGNSLTGAIDETILDKIRTKDPLQRIKGLEGSGLILKHDNKYFKL